MARIGETVAVPIGRNWMRRGMSEPVTKTVRSSTFCLGCRVWLTGRSASRVPATMIAAMAAPRDNSVFMKHITPGETGGQIEGDPAISPGITPSAASGQRDPSTPLRFAQDDKALRIARRLLSPLELLREAHVNEATGGVVGETGVSGGISLFTGRERRILTEHVVAANSEGQAFYPSLPG